MLDELKLSFEVLTPMFMGGASQAAELRPPSFKGLLRFWYRGVDPGFNKPWDKNGPHQISREEYLFGGSTNGAGQSPFWLRINSTKDAPVRSWDRSLVAKFNRGTGKNTRNGLIYLGFPFQMKGNEDQTAIQPGFVFEVRCLIPEGKNSEALRRALLASWWCLSHLGGAGSRARRGFGGLALREWRTKPKPWPELEDLPLLCHAETVKKWHAGFLSGFQAIRNWFGGFDSDARHPHLGNVSKVLLLPKRFAEKDWPAALDHAGRFLQDFRVRRQPDYEDVRDHLLAKNRRGGRFLEYAPDRTSFGLPLSFRHSSIKGRVDFLPYDDFLKSAGERHGSLLHIGLAPLEDGLHPLFVRLSGDVPGINPPAAVRGQSVALREPRENAMDRFLDSLSKG